MNSGVPITLSCDDLWFGYPLTTIFPRFAKTVRSQNERQKHSRNQKCKYLKMEYDEDCLSMTVNEVYFSIPL